MIVILEYIDLLSLILCLHSTVWIMISQIIHLVQCIDKLTKYSEGLITTKNFVSHL